MIKLNPSIEAIFSPANIDQDCDHIAHLMQPFQAQIDSYLDADNAASAIELFLQLLASTAKHFIEEEHWCYFDDFYSPDNLCIDIFRHFEDVYKSGKLSKESIMMLIDGLHEIEQTEAVQDYCCPSVERWLARLEK